MRPQGRAAPVGEDSDHDPPAPWERSPTIPGASLRNRAVRPYRLSPKKEKLVAMGMTATARAYAGSEEVRVCAVMHRNVTTVRPETGFQEIARLLVGSRISAVPVVDAERHVLGVVSADDLLTTRPHSFRYSQRASRVAPGRAAGRTAAELMSAPALVIDPDTRVTRAADLMQARHVKRLPVVDEERRLLGIVARSDLLEVYLRRASEPEAEPPRVLIPRERPLG